ncbi:hypothetical protein PUNSTDRAFT_116401 [Punctularia strigosozonata HHB-11173 SS5]|uniref:Mid2 domain-containing protein n=1 Tax=Punctularia strigosozonata (strain HHB-11173) TaxID=741275 RepID=R7S3F3_PUNST|nr:uncharacterized protein PUNSTDRAFT_116401 [Punctularia strigosozonata HHB-11173 SS5]EIN04399.1 hypothetical protein PUNSTDRAFT_116401 [Punctularia strigosozonata HHB-11173 SS5]
MFSAPLLLVAAAFVRAQVASAQSSDVSPSTTAADPLTVTICAGFVGASTSECVAAFTDSAGQLTAIPLPTTTGSVETLNCFGDGCELVSTNSLGQLTTSVQSPGAKATSTPGFFSGTHTICGDDQCWAEYWTGGGWAAVPISRTTYYATGTVAVTASGAVASSSSSSAPLDAVSSGSGSNRTLTVIVPAVVGTVGGLLLLILGAILYIRYRARKDAPSREWTKNPKLDLVAPGQAKGAREMSEAEVDDLHRNAFV